MKKFIELVILSFVLVISACSRNNEVKDKVNNEAKEEAKEERTLQSFIDSFVAAGTEVDPEEKPMFQVIDAKDGVIFYMDGKKVAIYEYESELVLQEVVKDNTLFVDWPEKFKLKSPTTITWQGTNLI